MQGASKIVFVFIIPNLDIQRWFSVGTVILDFKCGEVGENLNKLNRQ